MIETIQSTLFATFSHIINSVTPYPRVHTNLRDTALGYNYTCRFSLHCLYQDEAGDSGDPEEGFLKGPLLVCVSSKASLLDWILN